LSNSSGPGLEDFVTGQVDEVSFQDYQGKLKREAGDKRLRLPPWLKGKLIKMSDASKDVRLSYKKAFFNIDYFFCQDKVEKPVQL